MRTPSLIAIEPIIDVWHERKRYVWTRIMPVRFRLQTNILFCLLTVIDHLFRDHQSTHHRPWTTAQAQKNWLPHLPIYYLKCWLRMKSRRTTIFRQNRRILHLRMMKKEDSFSGLILILNHLVPEINALFAKTVNLSDRWCKLISVSMLFIWNCTNM